MIIMLFQKFCSQGGGVCNEILGKIRIVVFKKSLDH